MTGLNVVHSEVRNPEVLPEKPNFKNMYLDILVRTQEGIYIDIEMQSSSFGNAARDKSLAYLGRLYSNQLKGTEPYRFVPAHQIIFVDIRSNHGDVLISHMKLQDEIGNCLSDKMQAHIVYMPYIDDILKNKCIDELTLTEAIVYLFQNGITDDIIKLSKKYQEVAILMDKEDQFNDVESLYTVAESRKRFLIMQAAHVEDARNEGLKEGRVEGEQKSFQLITKLIADGKSDLIEEVAQDQELREQLYKEYHIE